MAEIYRTIENLVPLKRYALRVRAKSKLGVNSEWSEALEFLTPGDSSTPNPPTNLTASFDTVDLVLSWDAPGLNTNGTIFEDFSHYEITLINGPQSRIYETRNDTFVYTLSQNRSDWGTATPTLTVEVRAVDATQTKSTALTGVAQNPIPSQPQDITSFVIATTVNLSLLPDPADPDIAKYILERSPTGAGTWTQIYEGTGDSFSDFTNTEEVTLDYRYKVVDLFEQESPYSNIHIVTTQESTVGFDDDPPVAVEDFVVADNDIDPITLRPYITVTWSPNNTDLDLAHYELRVERTTDSFVQHHRISPNDSTFVIENLLEGTQYNLVIYSVDTSGNFSPPSSPVLSPTTAVNDLAPPTPVGYDTVPGIRTITVLWEPIDGYNQLSHYEVYAEPVSGFTPQTEVAATPYQNLVFSGNASRFVLEVNDNQTWYFRLRAVGLNGTASGFTAEFFDTSDDGFIAVDQATPNGNYFQVDGNGNIWIGDQNFADAPFRVNNLGAGQFRNVVITGDLMDAGAKIVDTPAFDVTKEGNVTANNITATGGTIGNVTIESDKLTGGTIQGSTFIIENSGQVLFQGSGTVAWDPAATGGIELSDQGYIENSTWDGVNGTSGWRIDDTGIYLNEGTLDANSIKIGISAVNFFKNSSFENDTEPDGIADFWNTSGDAVFSVSTEQAAYQSKAQKIVPNTTGDIYVAQTITRPNGENFKTDETIALSYWIRKTSGATFNAKIIAYDGGATPTLLYNGDPNTVTTTGGWTRIVELFKPIQEVESIEVQLYLVNAPAGANLYIDGAQAQLSDFATDWAPTPLEIPNNYIQNAYISDLSADKLTAGGIGAHIIELTGVGSIIQSESYGTEGWRIEGDGTATFNNGSVTIFSGADPGAGFGYTVLDGSSIRLIAGDGTDNSANTKFKANYEGVFIGGADANTAQVYFDVEESKTVFQASDTGYSFTIDTNAPDGKVLRLTDGAATPNETFYLTNDGQAFFLGGVIGLGDTGAGVGFQVNEFGDLWLGGTTFNNAVFSVSRTGDLTATSGTFKGSIVGGTIDIGSEPGSDPDSNPLTGFHVNSEGQMFVGHTSYGSAPFSVDKDGSLYAVDGQIANVTITSDKLSGGNIEGSTIIGALFKSDDVDTVPGRRIQLQDDIRIFGPSATDFTADYWKVYTTDQDNFLIEEGPGFPSAPDRGVAFRTLDSQTVRFQAYYGALEPTTLFLRIGDYGSGSPEDWSIGSSNQSGGTTDKGFMTYLDNDQCFAFTTSPLGSGQLLDIKANTVTTGNVVIQDGGTVDFNPTPTTAPTNLAVHEQAIHYRPDGTQSVDVVVSFDEPYNGQFYEIRIARAD